MFRSTLAIAVSLALGACSNAPKVQTPSGGSRIQVNSDATVVKTLASEQGFSVSKWVVALIRGHVTHRPQFGQHELDQLAQSNYQLVSIGRNLNQIARSLNTNPDDHSAYNVETIEALRDHIKAHTAKVSRLVAANTDRWKLK